MNRDDRTAVAQMLREAAALIESGRMTAACWVDVSGVRQIDAAHGRQGSVGARWRFEGMVDTGGVP